MKEWIVHTKKNIPEIFEYDNGEIDNPMMLWIELHCLFDTAVSTKNEDLIKRIFQEVHYYETYENNPNGDDFSTAVCLAFTEHLLDKENYIPYVLKYISRQKFIKYKALLTYHNDEKKYLNVLKQYTGK
ncbi:hypothetical protein QJU43_05980 [Pasteurella atlantica]|uniref:hypothetical protein n=1 Tax=Pasteurellaceae TaxID=712 RepID=UPI002745CF92|nr:hypothetical protein [Pasteurella atlantica]MDP8033923.1 hypothetical protein [Pasteurella atlantica]MDP8035797.1 hypothetical protein [Pasteurella atlantica]MDP8037807.1 hypothetical protein [Pasteurella atlantica]MDP8048217.1 hypothetical protein [Pasteurella atlantica]MDP8050177.1 hypothetical protein [Pasteurella atlantica]